MLNADMVVFGVDPTINEKDAKQVAFAVMATISHYTDDRGDIRTPRPLYEYPLLRRRYQKRGGDAKIVDDWLYHPKKPGVSLHPRTVPLTRLMLAQEMERLQKTFADLTPHGRESMFDKVYGIGVNNRFKQVVLDQAKAWNRLMAKIQAEGKPRSITQEELQAIGDIAEPANETVVDTDVVEAVQEPSATVGIDDTPDPIDALQNYLVGEGVDPSVALGVVKLHAEGEVSARKLDQIPELSKKALQINDTLRLYEKWKKTQVKEAAK